MIATNSHRSWKGGTSLLQPEDITFTRYLDASESINLRVPNRSIAEKNPLIEMGLIFIRKTLLNEQNFAESDHLRIQRIQGVEF